MKIAYQLASFSCGVEFIKRSCNSVGKFNKGKGDELYLYTKIKSLKNGGRVERKAGSGRWKNLKRGEQITQGDRTIAYRTTLTYYVVKDGKEERTCWSMHEYRLHRKKSERKMVSSESTCFNVVDCRPLYSDCFMSF